MPIGFLTDAQRHSYGRFNGEPTSDQLACYFHLDDADLKIIGERRGDHNRLGFAVQLCTVRFLGTFLENLSETAPGAVAFLGRQLSLQDPSVFSNYCLSEARWDHAGEIRSRYGLHDFTDPSARFRLNRWLYALCWTGTDRPSALFDRAIAWLITHKILLPGVTVLERHIVRIRTRAQERVWLRLTQAVSSETKAKLEALLTVPEEGHVSMLDRLRKGPFLRSAPELVRALRRIDDVRGLGINLSVSSRVPPTRVQALARFATMAKASAIRRMPDHRRLGTLIAFVLNLEAIALDDALGLLDILITEIFTDATRAGEKARLRTIKDLDEAAGRLGQVCALLLDPSVADSTLREAVFAVVKREDLEAALRQVERLVRPPEDMYYRELKESYRRVRTFLPSLLQTVCFGATPAGRPVLEALEFLRNPEQPEDRPRVGDPRIAIVTGAWRQYVFGDDERIDRKAFVFCFLDRLRSALRRRDLFIAPSFRYADARIGLLSGPAWESARPAVCRSLGHSLSAEETLLALGRQLDQTYQQVATNLSSNPLARVEKVDDKDELVLTSPDKVEEPPSLVRLRNEIAALLPRVDLPEILLEIAARTDFTAKFTHISERDSRAGNLAVSICAALLYVRKTYFSPEALRNANGAVVNKLLALRNPRLWGEGASSCASDATKFESWKQNPMVEWRSRYKGYGVMVYWHVETNAVCIYSQLKSFSSSEIAAMIEGLIRHDTEMRVEKNFVDSHGQSEVAFAFCHLLGSVRLMPRLKRIKYKRLYLPEKGIASDYPNLAGIFARAVRWDLIEQQYDEMVKAAVALKRGTATAEAILKRYNSYNVTHPTYKALAEVGKAEKSIFLCDYLSSRETRHEVHEGLNVVENWNATNDFICYGRQGELATNSREQQEIVTLSLQLLQNCLMLINTILVERTIEREGLWERLSAEDLRALTPLFHGHINPYGQFALDLNRPSFLEAA